MLLQRLVPFICITCCFCSQPLIRAAAQGAPALPAADTLRLDRKQAEKLFLDNNLQLLAAHYNIQSQQALVEQARKWENPNLVTDQNVYSNKHFFQHSVDANGNPNGEIYAQVQQLIKTAGKRGKQIDLARTNVNLADWQFRSTMRSLRATLVQDYYTIVQLMGNAALFGENMTRLLKLREAQKAQLAAGNIAQKEYLRIEALIISLQQDMTSNARNLNDAESELKTILSVTGNKFILPTEGEDEPTAIPAVSVTQLLDSARANNTDYRQEVYQLQYNRQNLKLQKAMAIPDVTLGPDFDQAANYTPNYFGLGISLPIPLWDRNQGNIRSARFQVKQEESLLSAADQKLQNDVLNAYEKLLYTLKLSSGDNSRFYQDYYKLQRNIAESYNNRQINLIEFLDYFNDYATVRQKQLQQVLDLRLAKENLNDVVGVDIIN